MKRDKDEKRFEITESESSFTKGNFQVVVDKETGVNYLVWQSGYAGGITPLLDSYGKPVVTLR